MTVTFPITVSKNHTWAIPQTHFFFNLISEVSHPKKADFITVPVIQPVLSTQNLNNCLDDFQMYVIFFIILLIYNLISTQSIKFYKRNQNGRHKH